MATNKSTPSPSKLTPDGALHSSKSKPSTEETARSDSLPDLQDPPWKPYWNSLNLDSKRDFFKVSSSDLLTFSQKFSKSQDLIIESLSFAQFNQKWNHWMCCCCTKKFPDPESHFQHLVGYHLNYCYSPSPELARLIFPLRIQDDWIWMINYATWKPADTDLVFIILQNKLALLSANGLQQVNPQQIPEFDPKQWIRGYFFHRNWPLSDDPKRQDCLVKIQSCLQKLLSDEILLPMHLDHVIHHAMVKLRQKFEVGFLWDVGLYKTHLCICLLGVPELQEIITFLDVLNKRSVVDEIEHSNDHGSRSFDTDVTIALNDKLLVVKWDEYGLCDGTTKPAALNAPYLKPREEHNLDSLLSWIFLTRPNLQQPESWANLREERILLGRKELLDFQQTLEKRKEEASALEQCVTQLANFTGNAFASNAQLLGRANWTLKLTEDIRQFVRKINHDVAAADYRLFLLFLLKAYFEDKLKRAISTDTRYVSEHLATGKHDGGNSSACNGLVVASQTTDNEMQSSVLGENDVHPIVSSEESQRQSEYLEKRNIEDGKGTGKSSDNLKWTEKAVEMRMVNGRDLPEENTQRGKAWIEADVGKEDLSSLQEEWSDMKHQWHKSVMSIPSKVDKEGALAQSVIQKKVEALFDKLVQDKLKRTISTDARYMSEHLATGKHDGGNSSACNGFVVASQTTDNKVQSSVLGGNDVHPTVSSEESRRQREFMEKRNTEDGKETGKSSNGLRTGKAAEMAIVNGKELPVFTQRGKPWIAADVGKENVSSLQEEWSHGKHQWHESLMSFQSKVNKEGGFAQSLSQKEAEALFHKFVRVATMPK